MAEYYSSLALVYNKYYLIMKHGIRFACMFITRSLRIYYRQNYKLCRSPLLHLYIIVCLWTLWISRSFHPFFRRGFGMSQLFLYSRVGFLLRTVIFTWLQVLLYVQSWKSSIGLMCVESSILILHPRGANLLHTELVGKDMSPPPSLPPSTLPLGHTVSVAQLGWIYFSYFQLLSYMKSYVNNITEWSRNLSHCMRVKLNRWKEVHYFVRGRIQEGCYYFLTQFKRHE